MPLSQLKWTLIFAVLFAIAGSGVTWLTMHPEDFETLMTWLAQR